MSWSMPIFNRTETSTWLNESQLHGQEKALRTIWLCGLFQGGGLAAHTFWLVFICWQIGCRAWCGLDFVSVSPGSQRGTICMVPKAPERMWARVWSTLLPPCPAQGMGDPGLQKTQTKKQKALHLLTKIRLVEKRNIQDLSVWLLVSVGGPSWGTPRTRGNAVLSSQQDGRNLGHMTVLVPVASDYIR